MSSKAEREVGDARVVKTVLYALLYAGAIALLVVFGPSEPHVFIYQEF